MNQWLAAAPEAQVAHAALGCMVSVNDLADRPPRPLHDGVVMVFGDKRLRRIETLHVPHGWDAGQFFEERGPPLACGERRRSDRRPRCGHTWLVATVTTVTVQRSGPAVGAALAEHAPAECAQFKADLRDALARASADLDLARVDAVLTRWHARATIVANPLTAAEQALVQRARAGDFTGLRAPGDDGAWTTL